MASSEIRGVVYSTEAEALAACDAIDLAMGLPNKAMDRWTLPIPVDGGWLVQSPRGDERGEVIARARLVEPDEATEAKLSAHVAAQEAKTRAVVAERERRGLPARPVKPVDERDAKPVEEATVRR